MNGENKLSGYCPACDKEVAFDIIKSDDIIRYHCDECYYLLWVKLADGTFVTGVDYARQEAKKLSEQQKIEQSGKPAGQPPALDSSVSSSLPPPPLDRLERPVSEIFDQEVQAAKETSDEMPKREMTDPSKQMANIHSQNLGIVMVVEDSALLRRIMSDILRERGIARQVIECPDGKVFTREYYRLVNVGKSPGLAIVDFNMPIMNGAHAGLAVRALERGLGIRPVPMLYFSVIRADDKVKKLLRYLTKTAYLYKSDSDPNRLADRLAAVITNISGHHPSDISAAM